jgi:hypothetical protein
LVELYRVIGDAEKAILAIPIFILSVELDRIDTPKLTYKPSTDLLVSKITYTISSMNQVVQEFEMMQQRMLVVHKQKKQEIMTRLEKEKNPLKKFIDDEEMTIVKETYFEKLSQDHDIQKYASKILSNLGKVCSDVTKDNSKDKWINSQLLWENKRRERYTKNWLEENWANITAIREFIENFDIQNEQIQAIKSSLPINCIVLDNSSFKQSLSEIVIFWQNSFMTCLQ